VQRVAFSYTRFSTLAQEQGDSECRQIESARRYAAEHGYILDESIAVDRGKSAFTGKNISEGALGEFIKRIEAQQIPKGSIPKILHKDNIKHPVRRVRRCRAVRKIFFWFFNPDPSEYCFSGKWKKYEYIRSSIQLSRTSDANELYKRRQLSTGYGAIQGTVPDRYARLDRRRGTE
jgi:hypothetical protein